MSFGTHFGTLFRLVGNFWQQCAGILQRSAAHGHLLVIFYDFVCQGHPQHLGGGMRPGGCGVMVKQHLGFPERGSTYTERRSGKVGAGTPS